MIPYTISYLNAVLSMAITTPLPTTPESMLSLSNELMQKYTAAVMTSEDVRYGYENSISGENATCKKVSKLWKQTCENYVCNNTSPAKPAKDGDREPSTQEVEAATFHLCCDRPSELHNSCDDAPTGDMLWFLDSSLSDADECCDTCAFGNPDEPMYKAMCTAENVQGASVCGTDSEGNLKMNPNVYFRDECSTGPTHTDEGAEEECSNGNCSTTCNVVSSELDELFQYYNNGGSRIRSEEEYNKLDSTVQHAFDGITSKSMQFVYVMNGPNTTNTAMIELDLASTDSSGAECISFMLYAYNEGSISLVAGHSMVIEPTTTSTASLIADSDSQLTVLGGSNAGNITIKTTGQVQIFGTHNSGQVNLVNAPNVFVANTSNNGDMIVTNSTVSVYNTVNNASIQFSGTSQATIRKTMNTGAILVRTVGSIIISDTVNAGPLDVQNTPNINIYNTHNLPSGNVLVHNSSASIFNSINEANILVRGGGSWNSSRVLNIGSIIGNRDATSFYAVQVENRGTIEINGGSGFLELCSNTGKVIIGEEVTGTVVAPTGSGQVSVPSGVTLLEYKGEPCINVDVTTPTSPASVATVTSKSPESGSNMFTNPEESCAFYQKCLKSEECASTYLSQVQKSLPDSCDMHYFFNDIICSSKEEDSFISLMTDVHDIFQSLSYHGSVFKDFDINSPKHLESISFLQESLNTIANLVKHAGFDAFAACMPSEFNEGIMEFLSGVKRFATAYRDVSVEHEKIFQPILDLTVSAEAALYNDSENDQDEGIGKDQGDDDDGTAGADHVTPSLVLVFLAIGSILGQ